MVSQIRENNLEEIKQKLATMNTDLNKLSYIEISLKEPSFSFEIKRFLLGKAAELYEDRKMYEKAAKAIANKASMEITNKDKIESYLKAGELYSKVGRVDQADDMFIRATRDSTPEQKQKIDLAKKNIYNIMAKDLEKIGKKATALKFYEKLIKMHIDPTEKSIIKQRLLEIYKSLGMFRESKLIEGI